MSTGIEKSQSNRKNRGATMKKRWLAVAKWGCFSLLALAVIYASLMIWSAWKLRQAYAAMEKDGRPMDLAQIIPPKPADRENAALVYQGAINLLNARPVKDSTTGNKTVFGELETAAYAFLNSANPESAAAAASLRKWFQDPFVFQILREVEAATVRPCQYDLDYSKGSKLRTPHLAYNRGLMGILCAKARLQAADGDAAGAWDSVISSLRFTDALKTEPHAMSQFCRMAYTPFYFNNLQQMAKTSLPTQGQWLSLDDQLKGFDSTRPLVLGMDSERLRAGEEIFKMSFAEMVEALSVESMQAVPHKGPKVWKPESPIEVFAVYASPLAKYDHAVYVDLYRRYAAVAGQPYSPESLRQLEAFENSIPRCGVFSRLVISWFVVWENKFTQFRAQAAVTRAGLVVLRYKQDKGAWPQSLAAAGVTEITDPFTQKQLLYKLTEKGFIIYSVGENQKDDGGKMVFQDGFMLDIAWDYQAPQAG
jgi:hypothetical protein